MAAQVNDRKKDVKQSWLPKSTTEKKTLNSHGCPSQRQKKDVKQSWLPKSTTEKKRYTVMAAQVNDRKKDVKQSWLPKSTTEKNTLNSHGCPSQRQKKDVKQYSKMWENRRKIRCVSKEVTSLKPKTGVNFVQKMQCFQCEYSLES